MPAAKSDNNGFTLIELLIVVAIIGILTAVATPYFTGYRLKAYNASAASDIKAVKMTLEGYYADNEGYPVF